ncbi:MAG: SGNH/GDSL hydrolase family protein [Oligoflexales bacterium]
MRFFVIFLQCFFSFTLHGQSHWALAVLGDSVSVASHAEHWDDSPEYSWATGDEISSIKVKIQEAGARVIGLNVAESGAVMGDLAQQVESLIDIGEGVDQAMILMGHNDVCHWGFDVQQENYEELAGTLKSSLQRLSEVYPDVEIYILEFLNIARVREIGLDRYFCQMKWDFADFCPIFMSSSSTDEERQLFLKSWSLAQNYLKSVAEEFSNVRWVDGLSKIPLEDQHVSSLDCIHPSRQGQQLLADQVWLRLNE